MKATTLFLLLIPVCVANAQYTNKIDSLQDLLKTDLSEKESAYVLDELSYEWFSQNLDSSLYYGQQARTQFRQLDDPKGLSQALTSVAVAFHYLGAWDSAKYNYENALRIRRADKDTAKTASSLNNLGVMYMDKEDYEKATEYFIEAMKVRGASRDSVGVAITKFNLGLIYKKQGNFQKAIETYQEVKADMERLNRENYLEVTLLNLGSIYNTVEEFEKGVEYNIQLRELAKKRDSQRNLAKSFVNLANSYQGLGLLDSSLYYGFKALTFFENNQDTLNIAHSLLSISQFYLSQKKYQQTIDYALRLTKLNASLENREILIENQLVLANAYAGVGQYKKAYEIMTDVFYQKDSLLSESQNQTITELTLKYDTEQKEREISQLRVINQQAIIEKQQSANQRNILIFVAIIVIVGAMLLYLLLRTKSKANAIISKSLNEKETLLKEIHHRVKNNLQIISSLLSLQSRFIDDKNVKAVVNESQDRVKSMALIHQKLYQHNNATGVKANDYIQQLTASLKSSYGIVSDKIDIVYDIDDVMVDVDTIIPIGLILNELISNAFKYAFPKNKEGTLSILLKEKEDHLLLEVRDNGIGVEENVEKKESFGLKMIHSLSRKLEGEMNFDFSKGTTATLQITKYKLV